MTTAEVYYVPDLQGDFFMKSIFRFGILAAIVLVTALTPALTTRAQGSYCPTGLSADDCKLLTDAGAGQSSVKTFVVDYSINLKTTGTPSDITASITGNGPIDISKIDTTSAATDPTSALKSLVLEDKVAVDVTAAGSPEQKVNAEIRIVGGVAYFMSDNMNGGKWYKADMSKGMGSMSSAAMNPAQIAKTFDPKTLAALTSLFGTAITGASADGPTIDGVATKQITINLDAEAFVKALGTPDAATAIMALAASQGQTVTADQIAQGQKQMTQFVTLLDPTLKATKIAFVVAVDPAAKQYREFKLTFSTTVDAQTAALFGGGSGAAKAITVDFSFDAKLSGLNAPVKVDPVADAVDASTSGSSSSSSAATPAQ